MSSRTRGIQSAATLAWWVAGITLAAMFIVPVFSAITGSLKSASELRQRPATLLPQQISFESWIRLFDPDDGLLGGITNSTLVSVGAVALTVVLSTLAGFGLGRFRFRGSGAVFLVLAAGMLIPFTVLLTPISVVLRTLGLSNTLLGVCLVYSAYQLPFCVLVLRNSFQAIPDETEEAALLDGCTRLTTLPRIFLPLVVPGIVTAAIFTFLNAWNEFIAALIILTDQGKFTLPILLKSVQIGRMGVVDWGILNTGVIISMVPCLLIFFLLQRYYISGVFAGASK